MKKTTKRKFPRGRDEKKIRDLIEYYDNQTDEEGAAEIEAADEVQGETWMSVPTELMQAVVRLIDKHQKNASNMRTRKRQGGRG